MRQITKIALAVVLLSSLSVFAQIDIQKNIYDGAEDIIRMDEKMNRAIAKHNQISPQEDADMRLSDIMVEDFEEIEGAYLLKKEIPDANRTKVDIKLENGMLTITTTTKELEKSINELNISYTTTMSSSEVSLFVPNDADQNGMEKKYENGILEIRFPKK